MLRKLLVFLWIAHLAFAVPTGYYPDTLIEDSVNLISGECTIFTQDMEVRGAEPLTINRLYINGTKKKKYAGWKFIPHLRLYRIIPVGIYNQYLNIYEPDGTLVRFNVPNEYVRGDPIELVPAIESTFRAQRRANRHTISGNNNLKNIKVYMTGNRNYIQVRSANGCERVYKECEALEYEGKKSEGKIHTMVRKHLLHQGQAKVRKYLLQSEDLPSGNRILYEYDKTYKVKTIRLVNPEKPDKILSEWKYTYDHDNEPDYRIVTSDGQIADYIHEHHDEDKARYKHTLARFSPTEKPVEHYTYTSPTKERGRLIQDRTFGDNTTLTYTYYEKGKNPTNYHNIKITDEDDFRIDRVKEIKRNSEVIYTFEYGVNPDESGWTKIQDAEGNHTAYFYNTLHQITKIERYDSKKQLQNINLYVYGEEERKADLLAAISLDNTGAPLIAKTYAYDDWGNITNETVWGNITGRSKTKLQLDNNNSPIDNGADKSTKIFRHSQEGRNLLTYEKDENGLETFYTYYDYSFRLKSKLIKHKNKICLRTFYEYNDDNILIKETHDDGSSENPSSYSDVTEQQICKTNPYQDGPFIGMPESIEESYIDLTTKQEKLIVKTQLTYKPNRKVDTKTVYDNQNKPVYTLKYNYDAHNNLITETNPLGKTATATYNDLRKKATFTDFDGQVKHTFDYDSSGLLYKTTHIDTDGTKKVEECKYNKLDLPSKKIDSYGNATLFDYDALGNCKETTLPDGTILKTSYNALSYPISQTDGEGHTTTILPNIFNKPLTIHHPDGTSEKYFYNLDGTLAESINPAGTITRYTYDHFKRLTSTSIHSPDGQLLTKETNIYTTLHLHKKIDPLGKSITYKYDGAGRKILETDDIVTSHFSYNHLGRLATTKNGSCTQTTKYDLLDRIKEETIHDGKGNLVSVVTYEYDDFNNQTKTTRSVAGSPATDKIDYDHFSRPIRMIDPLGNTITIDYNDNYINTQGQRVLLKSEYAPNGNRAIELYDTRNRLITRKIADANDIFLSRCDYEYDNNGNCKKQIDTVVEGPNHRKITTRREYTPTGKISRLIEAEGTKEQKTTTYDYDTAGRLKLVTNPNGTTITYTYDNLSRIKTLKTEGASYRYHYDSLGRITEVEDLLLHTSTTRTYDSRGNLAEETLGNGLTLTNDYDNEGRRTLLTLPDQTSIEYTYDTYHLRAITRHNHQTTYTHELLTYDLSSNLLAETGATHHYNLNGEKDEILTPYYTQTVTDRDKLGNILARITNNTPETYTYSPLSQITSEPHHTYTYDSIHNRTSKDTHPYTYNNANQLQNSPTAHFTNDTSGQPIHKQTPTSSITYTYDGLGRLLTATNHHHWRLAFTYDSFHRRLTRTLYHYINNTWTPVKHQSFLYDDICEIGSADQNHTIQELRILKDTSQAEIGAAIALELNNQIYIPVHDLQGNITGLVHEGQLIETHTYTAFGESTPSHITPWTYRSKRLDPELGLIFFGRRYYDPETGRFFTPDPKGFIDGLNLYSHCHNNPLTKIDLYGTNIYCNNPNIRVEFSIPLTTVGSILQMASSIAGSILYHSFNHLMPIPGVREVGMAVGNILSWDISGKRPITAIKSSSNIVSGHKPQNSCIFSVNGILTDEFDAQETTKKFSRSTGNMEINYFHSTTRGFLIDVLDAFWAKLGFQTADSIQMAGNMRTHIEAIKGTSDKSPEIFVLAHSRGGAYLYNALKLLTPEERKMIHVFTFGSASLFPNCGLASLTHYVAEGDPVPMTDPIKYLLARFSKSSNVKFLPGKGSFWSRHLIEGATYSEQKERVGDWIYRYIK